MDTSMTALVSAFARAWHSAQRGTKIFDDTVAQRLLTEEEFRRHYRESRHLSSGNGVR